jgi:hypothetical protein
MENLNCLSEFYIVIFLNKLKILENTKKYMKKNQNKTSMANAMGPSEIHRPLLGSPVPGPRT